MKESNTRARAQSSARAHSSRRHTRGSSTAPSASTLSAAARAAAVRARASTAARTSSACPPTRAAATCASSSRSAVGAAPAHRTNDKLPGSSSLGGCCVASWASGSGGARSRCAHAASRTAPSARPSVSPFCASPGVTPSASRRARALFARQVSPPSANAVRSMGRADPNKAWLLPRQSPSQPPSAGALHSSPARAARICAPPVASRDSSSACARVRSPAGREHSDWPSPDWLPGSTRQSSSPSGERAAASPPAAAASVSRSVA
mmetsp:Transcript_9052/g.21844  ORF Transcript_9052/g.21844 Transcript_9052/m.21844 type:complete len:264 (-) Transcript_9052:2184-2975(-)